MQYATDSLAHEKSQAIYILELTVNKICPTTLSMKFLQITLSDYPVHKCDVHSHIQSPRPSFAIGCGFCTSILLAAYSYYAVSN